MLARQLAPNEIVIRLDDNEAATLLAELRIVRDNSPDEFGAVSERLIDELESVVDEEEDEEEEEEEEDDDEDDREPHDQGSEEISS